MDEPLVEKKIRDFNENSSESNFRELTLPSTAIVLLIMFNINEYPKMLQLSSGWNFCIQEALDEYCGKYKLE
jgi:hypothetical protein